MTGKIILGGREITYELTKKKIKNINLRIKPDCSVSVSAPSRISKQRIEEFMRSKQQLTLFALDKYGKEKKKKKASLLKSGQKVTLFGESYTVILLKSDKCGALLSNGSLLLLTTSENDNALNEKIFDNLLKSHSLTVITQLCKKAHAEYYSWLGIDFPVIKVQKMKSRWGSCIPEKKILKFNTLLSLAPLAACEYVVAHEFTHFLHADHSERFYKELEKYMPDYNSRRRLLKNIL